MPVVQETCNKFVNTVDYTTIYPANSHSSKAGKATCIWGVISLATTDLSLKQYIFSAVNEIQNQRDVLDPK
jgi:hypothetical protein